MADVRNRKGEETERPGRTTERKGKATEGPNRTTERKGEATEDPSRTTEGKEGDGMLEQNDGWKRRSDGWKRVLLLTLRFRAKTICRPKRKVDSGRNYAES